jgi:hypothetical protein
MTSVRLTCALALLLPLAACTTAPAPSASVPGSAAAASPPKLLLISIDGLRADALDRGLTPNLQRMIDGGVRARWMTPSYPSLTFPNHYTIVTGLRPDHLRLAPATNRNLPAEVGHVEALGNEQLLTCRLLESSHLVMVRATPEQSAVVGQTVHLAIDPAGWRLFDGNGEALPRPRPAAKPPELTLPPIHG